MEFKEINARTRPFLSKQDIENKWIWRGCRHVLNVSQRDQSAEVIDRILNSGATYEWIPMGENQELDINLICKAMNLLLSYEDEETIVHCDLGNNRSRLICEFAMFAKYGKWMIDEVSTGLDGCLNKTAYNIKHGYLPEISIIEKIIQEFHK